MRMILKTFSFSVAIATLPLLLLSCAEKERGPSPEALAKYGDNPVALAFITDLENATADGISDEQIIAKIGRGEFAGQKTPQQQLAELQQAIDSVEPEKAEDDPHPALAGDELKFDDFVRFDHDTGQEVVVKKLLARTRQERLEIRRGVALGVRDKDCETLHATLDEFPFDFTMVRGRLYGTGTCFEQNLKEAISYYKEATENLLTQSAAHAHLGAIYANQPDIVSHESAAVDHYWWAVVFALSDLWYSQDFGRYSEAERALLDTVWQLTETEMIEGFRTLETGFWDIPAELERRLEVAKGWENGSGDEIVEVALRLRKEAADFDDLFLVEKWLLRATDMGNPRAMYLLGKLRLDRKTCARGTGSANCDESATNLSIYIHEAAAAGYEDALSFAIAFYQKSDHIPWNDWIAYQYALFAEKLGVAIDPETTTQVREDLVPIERDLVKAWIMSFGEPGIEHLLPELKPTD